METRGRESNARGKESRSIRGRPGGPMAVRNVPANAVPSLADVAAEAAPDIKVPDMLSDAMLDSLASALLSLAEEETIETASAPVKTARLDNLPESPPSVASLETVVKPTPDIPQADSNPAPKAPPPRGMGPKRNAGTSARTDGEVMRAKPTTERNGVPPKDATHTAPCEAPPMRARSAQPPPSLPPRARARGGLVRVQTAPVQSSGGSRTTSARTTTSTNSASFPPPMPARNSQVLTNGAPPPPVKPVPPVKPPQQAQPPKLQRQSTMPARSSVPPEPPPKPRRVGGTDSSNPVVSESGAGGPPVPPPKRDDRNSGAPSGSQATSPQMPAVSMPAADSPNPPTPKAPPPLKESLLRALTDPRVDLPELDNGRYVERRDFIAKEIMTSEQSYVKSMHILVHGFLQPLREIAHGKDSFVTKDQVEGLFQHIETILSLNREIYTHLKERVTVWEKDVKVADIFLEYLPLLKLYSAYTSSYERACVIYDQVERSTEFLRFLQFRKERPEFGGLDLRSYLIMPVQRIPRYSLLLKDLLKNTVDTHPDFEDIQKAVDRMSEIAQQVDVAIRLHEEKLKVIQIQNNIEGKVELVAPHRRFVREGPLMKICRKKAKARFFYLFNDLFCYCGEIAGSKKVQLHRSLKLKSASVVDVPDSDLLLNAFQFVNPEKSFTLIAVSKQEKYEWLTDIKNSIDELQNKSNRSGDVSVALAPVWMPDNMQVVCSICKNFFTKVKRRRHHCRACGCLCCGECSKHRFELPNLGKTSAQRVCNDCFEKLVKAAQDGKKHALIARKEKLYSHKPNAAQDSTALVPPGAEAEGEEEVLTVDVSVSCVIPGVVEDDADSEED